MRKQTKLVAVLSTAALLALGASMSSFAATGWAEENGTWVFYDKNEDLATERWEKSGENWFYLNEDGEMATEALVEYNDHYYYVDANGAMVVNQWVAIENEDYDGDDEEEPTNHWYYFGSNGRAYKSSSSSSSASFKTINGKKYLFDDEAKMMYGWIDEDGQKVTGDDAWREGVYYCGDENDGAQVANDWAYLNIVDNAWEVTDNLEKGLSSIDVFDDEDQTRWFFFKSNGKKMTDENGKTINGRRYSFDVDGRMNADWVNWDATQTTATVAGAGKTATQVQGSPVYSHGFRYYGDPEDGARVTKGWFQVVPGSFLNSSDYDDDAQSWYYSDKDGRLVAGEIKTINGKKYAFNSKGAMLDGYRFIKLAANNKDIIDVAKRDASLSYDTTDGFKENAAALEAAQYKFFYFGSSDDGAMKTGKQNVTIDGDSHSFLLNKSGSLKGAGKTGLDNKKYYQSGMLLTADRDDKYAVVKYYTDATDKILAASVLATDEFIREIGVSSVVTDDKYSEDFDVAAIAAGRAANPGVGSDEDAPAAATRVEYRLVNTAGTVQKSKNKAKDGNDYCYVVDGSSKITRIFVEN